ncbi:hypothetical protein [Pseudodesulfovibrio sp.]|uniref:hypothetical protein n=1 Tax=Pseudodesulfovibrio sp. TaxID=2035812 RepID=UPI00260BD7B4|nr:hypothetical protein [Pseudodesulfovibrio sp.]MDD3313829.1 hypothetical protein [Pseudodesulfovibrio sp.]
MIPKLDIKEKHFHGLLAVGGLAGIVEGSLRYGFTLHTVFPGMALTLVSAFLGAFCGFFLKDLLRCSQGLAPYRGVNHDGWMMGAFMGSFLGALVQVANSANEANLIVGAMAGAFLGAMAGAFPDEFVTPILELMRNEKSTAPAQGKHSPAK